MGSTWANKLQSPLVRCADVIDQALALAKDWGTDHPPWGERVWAELHGEERG